MGSPSCGGRKSSSPIDKAHGLYNSLYYRTSCDVLPFQLEKISVSKSLLNFHAHSVVIISKSLSCNKEPQWHAREVRGLQGPKAEWDSGTGQ